MLTPTERKVQGAIRKYKNARHNRIGSLTIAFQEAPHREARQKISDAFKRACNAADPSVVDHNFKVWEAELMRQDRSITSYKAYRAMAVAHELSWLELTGQHLLPIVSVKNEAEFKRFTGGEDA